MPCLKNAAVAKAMTKIVMTHEPNCSPICFQFTPFLTPSTIPMPTTPPVMHCEEDVGKPYCAATMITTAVMSSAQKPREAVILERREGIGMLKEGHDYGK